jgi:hypothetical protein
MLQLTAYSYRCKQIVLLDYIGNKTPVSLPVTVTVTPLHVACCWHYFQVTNTNRTQPLRRLNSTHNALKFVVKIGPKR